MDEDRTHPLKKVSLVVTAFKLPAWGLSQLQGLVSETEWTDGGARDSTQINICFSDQAMIFLEARTAYLMISKNYQIVLV